MANKNGTVNIDTIHEHFFVRTRLDDDHVLHLASLIEGGTKLPSILVTRNDNRVIDGRHRLAALKFCGKKAVDVEWCDETDEAKLLAMALRANIGGSLPPSNADIVYAIKQMLENGMPPGVITKEFSGVWPPAVVRRYYADAQGLLTRERVVKAKLAVIEEGMTVPEAALKFKIKLDTLKNAIAPTRKRKSTSGDIKRSLTAIFRSRGGSMGQIMRRIQTQMEDGDLSWKQVDDVLAHLEACAASTTRSVADWRKRLAATHGHKKPAVA